MKTITAAQKLIDTLAKYEQVVSTEKGKCGYTSNVGTMLLRHDTHHIDGRLFRSTFEIIGKTAKRIKVRIISESCNGNDWTKTITTIEERTVSLNTCLTMQKEFLKYGESWLCKLIEQEDEVEKESTYESTVEYELKVDKKNSNTFPKKQITSSKDAEAFCRNFFSDDLLIYESFFVLFLARNNSTIGFVKIGQGGISGTVVDKRLVAKYAIDTLCSGVILCHNHPSGNINPSEADKRLTQDLKEALKLFEIQVLDHIILTEEDYYSFADYGTL